MESLDYKSPHEVAFIGRATLSSRTSWLRGTTTARLARGLCPCMGQRRMGAGAPSWAAAGMPAAPNHCRELAYGLAAPCSSGARGPKGVHILPLGPLSRILIEGAEAAEAIPRNTQLPACSARSQGARHARVADAPSSQKHSGSPRWLCRGSPDPGRRGRV